MWSQVQEMSTYGNISSHTTTREGIPTSRTFRLTRGMLTSATAGVRRSTITRLRPREGSSLCLSPSRRPHIYTFLMETEQSRLLRKNYPLAELGGTNQPADNRRRVPTGGIVVPHDSSLAVSRSSRRSSTTSNRDEITGISKNVSLGISPTQ